MKKYVMYWSNICVLHKFEQTHIETITKQLLKKGIILQTEYFGIGYPSRMSEALLDLRRPLPDFIVSTDLEVFENKDIYQRFSQELHPICNWFSLKDSDRYNALYITPKLLPFIAIPMMIYTKNPSCQNLSLKTLLTKEVAFGGINNSGVKCIYKYIWEQAGKDRANAFLSRAKVFDMPIQGMQAVRTGVAELALIPSLYALRADLRSDFAFLLSEGSIALPSFAAVRNSVEENDARTVFEALLSTDFCNFFVQNADLVSCLKDSAKGRFEALAGSKLLYPCDSWFYQVSPGEFYENYCRLLPSAVNYSER